jgi:hypothetical protein
MQEAGRAIDPKNGVPLPPTVHELTRSGQLIDPAELTLAAGPLTGYALTWLTRNRYIAAATFPGTPTSGSRRRPKWKRYPNRLQAGRRCSDDCHLHEGSPAAEIAKGAILSG